jgi:hypothetical protein
VGRKDDETLSATFKTELAARLRCSRSCCETAFLKLSTNFVQSLALQSRCHSLVISHHKMRAWQFRLSDGMGLDKSVALDNTTTLLADVNMWRLDSKPRGGRRRRYPLLMPRV